MDRRSDALLGAAMMIVATNQFVTEGEIAARGGRATIAVINSGPQSINTIAGSVHLGLDIRSPTDSDVELIENLCRAKFQEISTEHGLTMKMDGFWTSPAVKFDPTMISCVRESAKEINCSMELTSGVSTFSLVVFSSTKWLILARITGWSRFCIYKP